MRRPQVIRSIRDLQGNAIHATDGDIGKVDEFYFDDDTWTIRYLVVQTGSWLSDRRVLISPISVRAADWQTHRIVVSLTREQIRQSPDIDTAKPISRQHESALNNYYGWPYYYWLGPEIWGGGLVPGDLWLGPPPVSPTGETVPGAQPEPPEETDTRDTHLRSTKEVLGYHIQAEDGEVGHVQDFLFDDESWHIHYMVVDTSDWWFGRRVIISPTSVKRVDWAERQVSVDLKRETIQHGPEFDPGTLLNRDGGV
jgi:sporulation protein YlmC with PRC-barrel domain